MSRDEVRAFDAWAINALGIAGVVLMENAGRSCAELIMKKLSGSSSSKVCIFCGTGNNGGDGFVIARHLHNDSFPVKVVICGRPEKIKGDARANLDLWLGLKQKIENLDFTEDITEQVNKFCNGTDLIVDAIFGTGLSGELKDGYKELVEAINKQDIPVVAVDIPSGLDCDTGRPLGAAIKAESTVTFAAMKKGFAENPQSLEYTGEVFVASIGVEPTAISI
ncbi:MAG: NAD(P)H-hydrate epimerase [Sedimentisphaerales bacterium]|nr:NAD(P)H-hydrate epimerase [Sedimentisphaerales bacterium]